MLAKHCRLRPLSRSADADGAGPGTADQVWTVYDGVNPYMDFDGAGQLQTRYLYGPGVDEFFARIGAGEDPEWYLVDRLGSVRQIVDASGAILDEITYDSFGGILSETNPAQGDRFKFTGREFSPELGIYYYRARWYDPGSGRFISQDPIGFSAGDVNLYRYVGNAPGDGIDPEGLEGPWRGYPYAPKNDSPKPLSFGWVTSVGNFFYEGMDLVFLEPVRMGGDLIRAGQFGFTHYFGWNPNEPDWRSRLAREVSQGDKSNWEIFVENEKENLVRGVCLIGGKVAGDSLGKAFRWFRTYKQVSPANPVSEIGDGIINWLGQGTKILRNDGKGFVIQSKDGLRQFRIDFSGSGTPPPHVHFEIRPNTSVKFRDAIPGKHRHHFGEE